MKNIKYTLPADFCIQRYGIQCRLVQERDAEFIVELRHDERLSRYVHNVGDVESQVKWISDYKKRERRGEDFYFIFSKNDIPFGLCRLYNIDWAHHSFTSGSWLCKPNIPYEVSLLISVITGDISQSLNLLIDIYDVRKDNSQVLKFHRKIVCAYEYGETNRDVLFMSTPETRKKSKLRKLLQLPPYEETESIDVIVQDFDY